MPTVGDIGAGTGGNRPQTENKNGRARAPAARETTAAVAGRDGAFVKLVPEIETGAQRPRARLRRAILALAASSRCGSRRFTVLFEISQSAEGRATIANRW
jgi:hypothetical protein